MLRFPLPGGISDLMVRRVVRTACEVDARWRSRIAAGRGSVSTESIQNMET